MDKRIRITTTLNRTARDAMRVVGVSAAIVGEIVDGVGVTA